jgi:phasin family protein
MASKNEPAMDLGKNFADLGKMIEQFKLPGVDTAEIVAARRKDIDALVQANQAAYEGMQALANKQADMLKQAMQDIQSAVKGGASSVGMGDPVKQGELARKAYEKLLSDMKELAEIARQSQADAMASITKRGAENLEEVKKMMKLK